MRSGRQAGGPRLSWLLLLLILLLPELCVDRGRAAAAAATTSAAAEVLAASASGVGSGQLLSRKLLRQRGRLLNWRQLEQLDNLEGCCFPCRPRGLQDLLPRRLAVC